MEKYKNKYRIKSHRMPNWDYSANGIYFLTILTQNRVCNLGKIVKTHGRTSVELSDFGKIVEMEFLKSFKIRDELFLDEFIIMPKSISSFMAGFKSATNSKIDNYIDDNQLNIPKYNQNNHFFQSNYFDHIIRNNTEYEHIKNYIINNPINWENDKSKLENFQ